MSFNLGLAACARKGEAARTLSLLGDMRRAGLLPTSVSYGAAVASCERAGDVDEVRPPFALLYTRLYIVISQSRVRPPRFVVCRHGGRLCLADNGIVGYVS